MLRRAVRHLAGTDERLGELIAEIGPCGLRRRAGGHANLFRSILGQQLSFKAASTIAQRLHAACGGAMSADAIARLGDAEFAGCGVSRQKRDYLRALAAVVLATPDLFAALEALPDETAVAALTEIRGVGRWTAEMYLIFTLGRLDVLPLGDVSICAAAVSLYGKRRAGTPARLRALAEHWRPYRSVACWYLYEHLDRVRPS